MADTPTTTAWRSRVTEEALSRIYVAEPYFALSDIEHAVDGYGVTATVPASPPSAPEVGAFTAAQAARHLAILGSCAAALLRETDEQLHYLAVGARYERLGATTTAPMLEPMIAGATACWDGKRKATASTFLTGSRGEPLVSLDVTYAVMNRKMFERFNPRVECDKPTNGSVEAITVEESPGSVIVDCGPVPLDLCAGHFPHLPVAPIALVMGKLANATRDALCSHLNSDIDYRVEAADVAATGLAQPGQQLVLRARHLEELDSGLHLVSGKALADGVEVGDLDITLAPIAG